MRKPKKASIFTLDSYRPDTPAVSGELAHGVTNADIELSEKLKPDALNNDERKIWEQLGPHLARAGRLDRLTAVVLYDYCVVTARIAQLRLKLDTDGWTYEVSGRSGDLIKYKPYVGQMNDDWRKWRTLATDLGLTPKAAKALKAMGDDSKDNFDDL